jgi:DNA-binding beta-propeller fold protein YncE
MRMKYLGVLSLALLICLPAFAETTATAESAYHLVKTISLPGDKGWDYALADSSNRRLYVTHGDRVMVLDMDADTLVGQVAPLQGIHGVALAPNLGRGYISDGKAGAVVSFDLKTLEILKVIPGRDDADAIIFEPATQQVFAFNGDDKSATVIDALTDSVVATLDLGGKPEFDAVDGKGLVYVNLVDKSELLTIDAKGHKIIRRSPSAPGEHPASLSMDVEGGNLFSGCHNQKAVVLDAATGKVKQVLAIGDRVDASVYDPVAGEIFHSCGDGTVSVAQKAADGSFSVLAPIVTKKGSRTMALDLKTHKLYLASADFEPAPITTTAQPHTRPKMIPGTFSVLVFSKD